MKVQLAAAGVLWTLAALAFQQGLDRSVGQPDELTASTSWREVPPVVDWSTDSLHAWGERLLGGALFGERSHHQVEDAARQPSALLATNPPAGALLSLLGIVGKPGEYHAIVAGLRGQEMGALLAAGDTAGGHRLREVGPTWAVLSGPDSTVRLTLRQERQ